MGHLIKMWLNQSFLNFMFQVVVISSLMVFTVMTIFLHLTGDVKIKPIKRLFERNIVERMRDFIHGWLITQASSFRLWRARSYSKIIYSRPYQFIEKRWPLCWTKTLELERKQKRDALQFKEAECLRRIEEFESRIDPLIKQITRVIIESYGSQHDPFQRYRVSVELSEYMIRSICERAFNHGNSQVEIAYIAKSVARLVEREMKTINFERLHDVDKRAARIADRLDFGNWRAEDE